MSALNAGLLLSEEATRRQRGITGDIESGAPEVKAQKYLMPLRHLASRAGRLCPRRGSTAGAISCAGLPHSSSTLS